MLLGPGERPQRARAPPATASRAKPLALAEEAVLVVSAPGAKEILKSARLNCRIGAGLAAAGFSIFLGTIGAHLPVPLLVVLAGGTLANVYVLAAITDRLACKLGARHVERLSILPQEGQHSTNTSGPADTSDERRETVGGALPIATLLTGAATAEERVAVTPEFELSIRNVCGERWVRLAEPLPDEWRTSFGDICKRLHLVHVDGASTCGDWAMVAAVLSSPKVVIEERLEPLEDVDRGLFNAFMNGPHFSELTSETVDRMAPVLNPTPPLESAKLLGRRALLGGASIFGAGGLFLIGESARDSDGVARYYNLWLP